jgi:hypothetical protein
MGQRIEGKRGGHSITLWGRTGVRGKTAGAAEVLLERTQDALQW